VNTLMNLSKRSFGLISISIIMFMAGGAAVYKMMHPTISFDVVAQSPADGGYNLNVIILNSSKNMLKVLVYEVFYDGKSIGKFSQLQLKSNEPISTQIHVEHPTAIDPTKISFSVIKAI